MRCLLRHLRWCRYEMLVLRHLAANRRDLKTPKARGRYRPHWAISPCRYIIHSVIESNHLVFESSSVVEMGFDPPTQQLDLLKIILARTRQGDIAHTLGDIALLIYYSTR